jgi:hypothetical protein
MKKIRFVVDLDMNLFFHLEKLTGSTKKRFSKTYEAKYPEFENLTKKFRWEFDPQVISWKFKKRLKITKGFKLAGAEFGRGIEKIFLEAKKLYKPYWPEIKNKLFALRREIECNKNELEELVVKIEKFTKIPFKKRINIYLVEALSEEYGNGAEPLDDGIAIGRTKNPFLLKMRIIHELVHLNLMNKLIMYIPAKYKKDESKINEAITDLITFSVLNIKFPKQTRNPYMKLFQPYFHKIKNLEDVEKFLERRVFK